MDSIFSAGWELRSFTSREGKHGEWEVSESWGHLKQLCIEDWELLTVKCREWLHLESFWLRSRGYEHCPDISPPTPTSPHLAFWHSSPPSFIMCRLCFSWQIPGGQEPLSNSSCIPVVPSAILCPPRRLSKYLLREGVGGWIRTRCLWLRKIPSPTWVHLPHSYAGLAPFLLQGF